MAHVTGLWRIHSGRVKSDILQYKMKEGFKSRKTRIKSWSLTTGFRCSISLYAWLMQVTLLVWACSQNFFPFGHLSSSCAEKWINPFWTCFKSFKSIKKVLAIWFWQLTFPTTCLLIHLFLHESGQSRQLSFLEIIWALKKINWSELNALEPGGHLKIRQWALTIWLYNQQAQSFLLVYKYIRLD